ncbi:NAD(P)-binding protein [Penicillium hispanicum]|uniref:NAD(P)-binding protein n=1 Tax=Penicillium hispanicum TaxID=1080232 RepID=UPI002541E61C|nr:NAD(P)-binding protein [Penicillium hispanicum]KAJ5577652.1 NAD(P)-binding protein [Penicillium hispanicum]
MAVKYATDQPGGFTNRIEKVAIVGAGAIQRAESTSKLPDGINVIRVDYSGEDDSALVEALKGQQVLIVTMAIPAQMVAIPKLVNAAAKAGVPYIMPNWFGHDAANDKLCEDSMLKTNRDKINQQIASLGVSTPLLLKRTLTWLDDGDVALKTSTWPQCGRAIAGLLSLKELPDDESDTSPTLSRFADRPVYISSFRVTQRDMFESVKRVTGTTDAYWTITRDSSAKRWEEGFAAVKQGNFGAFTKMLYSRMFFPSADGDYQSRRELDNEALGLPVEDFDAATAVAVQMGEKGEVAHSH